MITRSLFRLAMCGTFGVCLAAPRDARAQFRDSSWPNTRGFFLKFSAGAASFGADSVNTASETGLGTSMGMGMGFNRNIALVFDGAGMFYRRGHIDKYHNDYFDVGVRWHFPRAERRLVPYADLMITAIFLLKDSVTAASVPVGKSLASKHDIDCSCYSVGGGLLYYLTSTWAIDGNVHGTWGNFKTSPAGSAVPNLEFSTHALRANVGVAWYPDVR